MTRVRAFVVAVILLAAAIIGTRYYHRGLTASATHSSVLSATQGARLLDAVMQRVSDSWVDSTSEEDLYERATAGLVPRSAR